MGITTKANLPLVSATKFNVSNAAAIAGAASPGYGSYTAAGNGDWVLGSAMPKGRKLLVVINTSTLANAVAALKVALMKGDDANGTNGAEVASTITEIATPAGDSVYTAEIDLAAVDDLTKYYSLGLAVRSTSNAADTLIADAAALVLDPTYI